MTLLEQPNRWSCGPTALAMLLGITVQEVIDDIGHDGSAIVYPLYPEPNNRAGFHIDEFQDLLYKRGLGLIQYTAIPQSISREGDTPHSHYTPEKCELRIMDLIARHKGLLIGRESADRCHMVAFDKLQIFDPTGPKQYSLLDSNFIVEFVYVLGRLESNHV